MSGIMWITIFFLLLSFFLCHPATAQDRDPCQPNPRLTPGRATNITAAELCKPGYKNPDRHIPVELKDQVFARYRIDRYDHGYNVDHLIPVRLGGSNSIENLWPQRLSGEWCWDRKNELERRLRKLVCGGQLDLKTAQREIAADWVGAYKKYVGGPGQTRSE